jgi:hypothetical protein
LENNSVVSSAEIGDTHTNSMISAVVRNDFFLALVHKVILS